MKGLWKSDLIFPAALVLLAIFAYFIPDADAERQQKVAEFNAKVMRACLPEEGQRTVVSRDDSFFHFTKIDIGPGRYSRSFPHVEVRVEHFEEQL